MTRSRGRPERRTFYISCTDEQWAEAKGRAAAAGMKTSPWLVERATDAGDQECLAESVGSMTEFVDGLFDEKAIERIGNQVAFMCDVKATEMIAGGRVDELFLAFGKLVGPENAEWLLAKAVREWHGASSVDVVVHGSKRQE